jgi:PAS domain S-box-containing protein
MDIPALPDELDRADTIGVRDHADAYLSLFERSGICMAHVDPGLQVQDANEQFSRDLGWATETVIGRPLFDFLHHGAQLGLRRQLARLTRGRCERVTERVLGVRSGECLLPAQLTAVAVRQGSLVVMLQWEEAEVGTGELTIRRKMLSELDARILEGVAMGMSAASLATKLYLSRQGVEYHVGTMLRKLRASNRAVMVSRAYSMGVLRAGSWPPQVEPSFIK